jgi:hypothetical protein
MMTIAQIIMIITLASRQKTHYNCLKQITYYLEVNSRECGPEVNVQGPRVLIILSLPFSPNATS